MLLISRFSAPCHICSGIGIGFYLLSARISQARPAGGSALIWFPVFPFLPKFANSNQNPANRKLHRHNPNKTRNHKKDDFTIAIPSKPCPHANKNCEQNKWTAFSHLLAFAFPFLI